MKDILDRAVEGDLVWGEREITHVNIQIDGDVELIWDEGCFWVPLWELIFSHDFLKAYYGEENVDVYCTICDMSDTSMPAWQYYGQQLVLAEDRLAYLRKEI